MEKTPLEQWISEKIKWNGSGSLREHIEKYQLEKIRENIEYVKENSVFYKKHLEHISPGTINSFEDFSRVPFTYAHHIKEDPIRFLCVSPKYIERIVTLDTSGTSGIPKRVYFTEDDQKLTIDFFQRGMNCLVNSSDRVLILLPGETQGSVGDLLKKGLARSGIEAFIYGPVKDYCHASQIIKEKKISCIVGIPVQVLNLKRKYGSIFNEYIRRVLLSTDYVPQEVIKELSSEKCKVFTHYGMTEMGLGGGVECEALDGYHMREADLYFEIVDPGTGEKVNDGEYGEIVFTTLTRIGMPLIRYRTGDIGRFYREPCRCGTVLRTMERVSGRIENTIRLHENKFLSMRELDEVIFECKGIVNYEAEIADDIDKHCDNIIIKLQCEDASDDIRLQLIKKLCDIPVIDEGLKNGRLDLTVEIFHDNINTGNGTLKRKIKDNRKRC